MASLDANIMEASGDVPDVPIPLHIKHPETMMDVRDWKLLFGPFSARCLPSGKRFQNYGDSSFFMGKLTISMAIFNSKLLNYQVSSGFWMLSGLVDQWRRVPVLRMWSLCVGIPTSQDLSVGFAYRGFS